MKVTVNDGIFLSLKVKILRRCTKGEEKTAVKHNLMDTPLDFFHSLKPSNEFAKKLEDPPGVSATLPTPMTFINLPVLKSCVVEDEIEGADDCVEDHLLLLQLDVHLQVEQHPGNLLYLKSTVLNYFEAKAILRACPFSMTLKICFNFFV